ILIIVMIHNLGSYNPNIINASFHIIYFAGSGSGMTAGLILALLLFSKSKNDKKLAKENLTPALFNINEGVIFGLPLVGESIYRIPFMIAPIISAVYGYSMHYFVM